MRKRLTRKAGPDKVFDALEAAAYHGDMDDQFVQDFRNSLHFAEVAANSASQAVDDCYDAYSKAKDAYAHAHHAMEEADEAPDDYSEDDIKGIQLAVAYASYVVKSAGDVYEDSIRFGKKAKESRMNASWYLDRILEEFDKGN